MAVRDLGFMAWKNDLAHLERQEGAEWEKAVNDEVEGFKEALKGRRIQSEIRTAKASLRPLLHLPTWLIRGWTVTKMPFSPQEVWQHGEFKCKAWDADPYKDYFAAVVQDPSGFERFTVEIYRSKVKIAELQQAGPQIAWLSDGTLAYLGSSKDLRYDTFMVWSPKTMESKILYRLDDLTESLELQRLGGKLHVVKNDYVKETVVLRTNLPITKGPAVSVKITVEDGIHTVSDNGKRIVTVWGEIYTDPRDPQQIHVIDMRYEPYSMRLYRNTTWVFDKDSEPKPYPFPCEYYNDVAPTFVVRPRMVARPKGLLVTAYGAYGSPTRIGTLILQWRPLLERGWIVAAVCLPGGGDGDAAWKRAGQRLNRGHAIRVLTDAIRRLQEEFGIPAEATALYGRSAGGLLVSSAALGTPGLVGGLYLESPYVDVLRTISNPDLPLTTLETREFGTATLTDIVTTGDWSPMERIPAKGLDLVVIARAGLNDLEVYPYEVLKFIKRLRGLKPGTGSDTKLLFIHSGRGHFTTDIQTRAEDIVLLDSFMRTKNPMYKYKMAGLSRKNKTQKNRNGGGKKNLSSKQRNNKVGGKKSRKVARKH